MSIRPHQMAGALALTFSAVALAYILVRSPHQESATKNAFPDALPGRANSGVGSQSSAVSSADYDRLARIASQSSSEERPSPIAPSHLAGPLLKTPTIVWEPGNKEQLERAELELLARIRRLEIATSSSIWSDLSAVTTDIAALGRVLDSAPTPRIPRNVGPPTHRRDGTAYPAQLLFSGIAPSAIKDLEQRKAYEDALSKAKEDSAKMAWLVEAKGVHRISRSNLQNQLQILLRKGTISDAIAASVLDAVKRKEEIGK